METISLKVDAGMAKDIDDIMKKQRYATKTELIRDAIRKKITDAKKQEMIDAINATFGSSKHKTTDEDLHRVGEEVAEQLLHEALRKKSH